MSMKEIINDIKLKSEGGNRGFQVGDRVIWKPIDRRDMSQDEAHGWYGAKGTVIELDIIAGGVIKNAYIALDDFPECNCRETKNRYYAGFDELELINERENKE